MTGAKQAFATQTMVSHNIANAATTGFRADLHAMQSRPVLGAGYPTRVNALVAQGGWDRSQGAQEATGRDLDVAIMGQGFIAVQAADGSEAYTRAGDLQLDEEGRLMTGTGHPVLGQQGPITLPASTAIQIGTDGTISVVAQGQGPETVGAVERIKLVKPDTAQLGKGPDGLMRLPGGATAPADAGVRLISGSIESSNVNIPGALVDMIEISRYYETQVRLMNVVNENAATTQRLVSQSG